MSKITIALLLLISTFTPMMAKDGYNVSLMSEPRIGIGTGINSEIPSIRPKGDCPWQADAAA